MGDEQDGLALGHPEALQFDVHVLARHGVERTERFVHQQHRRIVHQGADNADPLLHAAGELGGIALFELAQSNEINELTRPRQILLAIKLLDVDRDQHVVENGAPGKQHGRLEHDADVVSRPLQLAVAEPDSSRTGRDQSCEDTKQRRFPAARRTHNRDEFAEADIEVDILKRASRPARDRRTVFRLP